MNPGFSKLVECVPNISEGRDRVAISRIVESVAMVPGVQILHVDSGVTTNRTVITFVGEPTVCLRAGVALFDAAVEHIDMRKHTGAHPRLGAVDVFPFVPLERTSMAECIALAHELGELVWERHKIPVFFYEHAAKQRERQNLAAVRRGEYEGLPEKLEDPNWVPDCGLPQRNERSGATIIGARTFLVAYNISLGAGDVRVAQTIAAKLRESGSTKKQEDGTTTQTPGRFTHCRAIGWQVPELGGAQVSVNFTDFSITGLYPVFEACVQEARAQGTSVKGSELIGLVPKQALLDVTLSLTSGLGDDSLTERGRLESAAQALKLDTIKPFSLDERVLEYRLQHSSLCDLSVDELLAKFGSGSPTPGGGSAAALAGYLGVSLLRMTLEISERKCTDASSQRALQTARDHCEQTAARFRFFVDEDSRTYDDLRQVNREARAVTAEDSPTAELLTQVIESAEASAIRIPREVIILANQTLELLSSIKPQINDVVRSDLLVAEALLRAAVEGAQAVLDG